MQVENDTPIETEMQPLTQLTGNELLLARGCVSSNKI